MNDQQRAAMQMALEALKKAQRQLVYNDVAPHEFYDEAITAMREALEVSSGGMKSNSGGMAQPQGKPVAWVHKSALHWISDAGDSACVSTSLWKKENEVCNVPLYTTPPTVEAVAGSDDDTDKAAELGWHLQAQIKAAIEATKEKAAKVCEEQMGWLDNGGGELCAAAIRSME